MAPSAVDDPASEAVDVKMTDEKTYPPANIVPVRETRFEKYTEPQSDGREKALEQYSDSAAIVIDNGESHPSQAKLNPSCPTADVLTRSASQDRPP